ncbi:MAG: HAD family phosphatase, partial [Treponema sp.]|nr:HAD family phosphatase [Treponema sp.]
MKMERKSLLFFDIDGTIFDDHRQLPKSVRPAMEEARKNGCQLIINTGRTLCQIDRRLDGFPLDGWIMGCGTRIIYHDETIQSMEYDLKSSLKLKKIFLDLKIPLVYECDTGMYFDPDFSSHPDVKRLRKWSEERGIYREITESDANFRAVKMFCFTPKASIEAMEKLSAQIGMPY